jgi:hypothetical protein
LDTFGCAPAGSSRVRATLKLPASFWLADDEEWTEPNSAAWWQYSSDLPSRFSGTVIVSFVSSVPPRTSIRSPLPGFDAGPVELLEPGVVVAFREPEAGQAVIWFHLATV